MSHLIFLLQLLLSNVNKGGYNIDYVMSKYVAKHLAVKAIMQHFVT